jgi:hypothetical protein
VSDLWCGVVGGGVMGEKKKGTGRPVFVAATYRVARGRNRPLRAGVCLLPCFVPRGPGPWELLALGALALGAGAFGPWTCRSAGREDFGAGWGGLSGQTIEGVTRRVWIWEGA